MSARYLTALLAVWIVLTSSVSAQNSNSAATGNTPTTIRERLQEQRDAYREQQAAARRDLQALLKKSGETSRTELAAALVEYRAQRDQLRQKYRSELERLRARTQEELLQLKERRREQLEALKQRREQLKNTSLPLTDSIRQERLARANGYATSVAVRLDAAGIRLLSLSHKLQTRVDQITNQTVKNELAAELAELALVQQELDLQVAEAKSSLEAIATSEDVQAAVADAQAKVETAVETINSLTASLREVGNKLP